MNGSNRPGGDEAPAASAASSVAQPPAFQRDAGGSPFPVAGAILLLVLLVIAAWAWTAGRQRGRLPARLSSSKRWPFLAPAANAPPMKVVASARLDVGGRAHVVEWSGQQVLIAINGSSAPVVLARRRLADEARKLDP